MRPFWRGFTEAYPAACFGLYIPAVCICVVAGFYISACLFAAGCFVAAWIVIDMENGR